MRKTLVALAGYLKTIVVPETEEAYAVNPVFEAVSTDEKIRESVRAFHVFLCRIFDVLIAKGDAHDQHKKVAHEYENRTTLSVYYPFLHNVNMLLMRMGFHGVLIENDTVLSCGGNVFNEKLSASKTMECLHFLTDCGMHIDGIDWNEKKLNVAAVKSIQILYPDDPVMLLGMKVMATAEIELGSLVNQDVFLRCDYRILKREEADVRSILEDTIKPLPAGVQRFIMQLHQRYTGKGLKCSVEIKGFWMYFKYAYKRKDVWGINVSLNNGFHINVKTQNMHRYTDTIETFPLLLQDLIAKGFGCGRKREDIGHCDGGCRGMPISLDKSVLDMKEDIIAWFDRELDFL